MLSIAVARPGFGADFSGGGRRAGRLIGKTYDPSKHLSERPASRALPLVGFTLLEVTYRLYIMKLR